MKGIVTMSWRASPAELYQPKSCLSGTSCWSAPGPFGSRLLYYFHRVSQKCPSHRSPGSKTLGGHLGRWPSKLCSDSPIPASPCLCFPCTVPHRRKKRPQCDPSSPRPGGVHTSPVQSSDMLSLGWCGAGTSGRWTPVATSVQTHCLLPSGLALLFSWGSLSRCPSFCCGQWLHSPQGYPPGAKMGCYWWHWGFHIWFCPFQGLSSVLFHIIKSTPAVSFLGKLVREKVNHQLPVTLRHFYNKDGFHQSIV